MHRFSKMDTILENELIIHDFAKNQPILNHKEVYGILCIKEIKTVYFFFLFRNKNSFVPLFLHNGIEGSNWLRAQWSAMNKFTICARGW